MKNLHVVPTDKPSRLYHWKGNDTYNSQFRLRPIAGFCDFNQNDTINQNIYITSDEALPYDDSIFDNGAFYHRDAVGDVYIITKHTFKPNPHFCKRIILTTDQDLIADGVQAIDDEFLEWFVKNPSCEFVEWSSEKIEGSFDGEDWKFNYGIVIPKEEHKQDCKHDIVTKYGVAECQNCGMEESEIVREEHKQQTFTKPDDTDGQWLSPIPSERKWQEEQLVNIFEHYPNASPKWQYMNGLIQNSLDAREMYSEEEVKEIIKLSCEEGMLIQRTINDKVKIPYMRIKDFTIKIFEQFKKK